MTNRIKFVLSMLVASALLGVLFHAIKGVGAPHVSPYDCCPPPIRNSAVPRFPQNSTVDIYFRNIDGLTEAEKQGIQEGLEAWNGRNNSSGLTFFSSAAPQPPPLAGDIKNGFRALAVYDKSDSGGNGDNVIDKKDFVFSSLRLWQDLNHNGVSEATELHKLKELGLKSINLDYKSSKRVDSNGNSFRYRAKVKNTHDAQLGRWAWDVFLVAHGL